jgi:hypothetical protein
MAGRVLSLFSSAVAGGWDNGPLRELTRRLPIAGNFLYVPIRRRRPAAEIGECEMGVKPIVTNFALAMGIGALWAGTAVAGGTGGSAAGAAKAKSAKEDTSRRVCRNLTPSGTRLTTRTCRTQAAWDERQDKTQEGVLRHQINESTGMEQGPGPL